MICKTIMNNSSSIIVSLVREWVYVYGCNLESVLIHVLNTTMNFESKEESHKMEEQH